ncbi:MAG TPA: hypothetical protein VF406_12990 [Thermodesulfobacteriota bacterium]
MTDAQGRYRIPGWGPKWRPWFKWLDLYDPGLVIFKPGYWPESFANYQDPEFGYGPRFNPREAASRRAAMNGRVIRLQPFEIGKPIVPQLRDPKSNPYPDKEILTEEEWAEQIMGIQAVLSWSSGPSGWSRREWLRIRNLVRLVNQECLRLPRHLQRRLDRVPGDLATALFGDVPPCN